MKAAFLVCATVTALFACGVRGSGASDSPEGLGTAEQGISGGTDTTSYPFTVGIKIGNQGTCSGTLIAPNLVLTARHCVSTIDTGEQILPSSMFNGNYDADVFKVTTNATIGNTGRTVTEVLYPNTNKVLGNDIAMLILSSNVPSVEVTPAVPIVQHAAFNLARYSLVFTAIGYGITGPGNNDSGQRRIRKNIDVLCMDGSQVPGSCAGAVDDNGVRVIAPSEFLSGAGVCRGDSGSGAFPQKNFNAAGTIFTYGVLSRGPQASCDNGIYTRTDSHKAFIIAGANAAATAGGYSPPSWTVAEAQDPQDAPYTGPPAKDGGKDGSKSDGAAAPGSGFGEACADDAECTSGLCRTIDQAGACTQACAEDNPCPDGFTCEGEICTKPAPVVKPTPTAPTTPASETTSSGCAVDPTKPTPWRGSLVFGLIAASVLVRRRARK